MSETIYDAHPSMIRSRPFGTLIAVALIPLGIAIALMGHQLGAEAAPVAKVAGRITLQLIANHNLDIWWKNRHISLYVPMSG
jgi:hypothetical protein